MVSLKEKINAETENITKVLIELDKVKDRPNKELVVIVGIGAYFQNIYTGVENILKQLLLHNNISIHDTPSWHKNVLNLSVQNNFITKETANKMGKYLFFRHFFTHSYGFLIDEEKLKPLMNNIFDTFYEFKKEINNYLSNIESNK